MGLPTGGAFADVEAAPDFDLLPKGNYLFVVYEGEMREAGENAKHPGSQYINWQFRVADEDSEYNNRVVFHMTSLWGLDPEEREGEDEADVAKALGRIKKFLLDVGYTEDEIAAEDFEIDIDDITGRYVMGEVYIKKSDDYGDKNQIRRLWQPDFEEDEDGELPG